MIKKAIKWFCYLFAGVTGCFFLFSVASCGKADVAGPAGTNVEYEIINLSPDLNPVDLYINFIKSNSTPYIFAASPTYFYPTSLTTPYQIRSDRFTATTFFSRYDTLKSGVKYSLFITGTQSNSSIKQIFTVDTAGEPTVGRGKVRFINASPTAISGLDVYANGTKAFSSVVYPNVTKYIELPVGDYDFQINTTGSSSILKDLTDITIQDGRLYTIYAYGYTSRVDTAAFNAAYIINK